MKHIGTLTGAIALAAVGLTQPASADDVVKLTIGQRGNWDTSITHLGDKAGIFKKHGIQLEPWMGHTPFRPRLVEIRADSLPEVL